MKLKSLCLLEWEQDTALHQVLTLVTDVGWPWHRPRYSITGYPATITLSTHACSISVKKSLKNIFFWVNLFRTDKMQSTKIYSLLEIQVSEDEVRVFWNSGLCRCCWPALGWHSQSRRKCRALTIEKCLSYSPASQSVSVQKKVIQNASLRDL